MPGSAPRRSRSAGSPASWRPSRRCSESWAIAPPTTCAPSIRRRRTPSSAPWCIAGRAASISPRCCGSCGRCWSSRARSSGSSPRDWTAGTSTSARPSISFSRRALALDMRRVYGRVPKRAGVCYFFPRPSAGSACKRLNLYLRWMVRTDEVDLGVWRAVRPGQLIVPLDTHVIRLAQCLRLTRYVSPGWKMAADITAHLRRAGSARSGEIRLLDLSRGNDERLRIRPPAGRQPMSAERALPSSSPARLVCSAAVAVIALGFSVSACRRGPDVYVVQSRSAPAAGSEPRAIAAATLARCDGGWCETLAIGASADAAQALATLPAISRAVHRDRVVAQRRARRVPDQRHPVAPLRCRFACAGRPNRSGPPRCRSVHQNRPRVDLLRQRRRDHLRRLPARSIGMPAGDCRAAVARRTTDGVPGNVSRPPAHSLRRRTVSA